MKIKTYENLIIYMFQQKCEILALQNFVPIRYTVFPSAGYYTGLYNFMRLAFFIIKANEPSKKTFVMQYYHLSSFQLL